MDWLVAGLGNPGKEYDLTPHNMGFMVCDSLSFLFNFEFGFQRKFQGLFGFFYLNTSKIGVLKPMTYMNLSGNSVASAVSFYNMAHSRLIVIHDDIDLQFGRIRIKKNSSSGGHKGVESVIRALGSQDFIRIKIGVGREGDPARYVLTKFNDEEIDLVKKIIEKASEAVVSIIKDGVAKTMSKYNNRLMLGVGEGERV